MSDLPNFVSIVQISSYMEPDMEEDAREFTGEPADDEMGDIRRKDKAGD